MMEKGLTNDVTHKGLFPVLSPAANFPLFCLAPLPVQYPLASAVYLGKDATLQEGTKPAKPVNNGTNSGGKWLFD